MSRHAKGIIGTSVVIDYVDINHEKLPIEVAISAITLGELAAGPHAAEMPTNAHGGKIASNEPSRSLKLCHLTPLLRARTDASLQPCWPADGNHAVRAL